MMQPKHLWLFNKNKLLILRSLYDCTDNMCGCDIRENLEIPKNLLSHHIKGLREKGFIEEKKCGRTKQYIISESKRETVTKILQAVEMI